MTDLATASVADLELLITDDVIPPVDFESAESRETKGERTRRRLLELAIERFGQRGFRATSVSEIARAADLTQAAAYAYFEGKDALFEAAVEADAGSLIDEVAERVAGLPVRELIPSMIVWAVVGLDAHPLARRLLAGQEPDQIPRLAELQAMRRFGSLIAAELRVAKERGEVRQDLDPEVVAAGIESLVLGLLFSMVLAGPSSDSRRLDGVVEAFDLMLRPSV